MALQTQEPLLRRHRSLLSFTSLTAPQRELEERLRTLCLLIIASGVVSYGLARLKFALVPLVLSLSLKYLLQPMIDVMTGDSLVNYDAYPSEKLLPSTLDDSTLRSRLWNRIAVLLVVTCPRALGNVLSRCFCCFKCCKGLTRLLLRRPRLPHVVAVVIALLVAFSFLALAIAIVAESIRDFTSRADAYAAQVQLLIVQGLRWLDATGIDERWRKPQTLEKVADKLDLSSFVTATVLSLGEGLLSLLSTTMLVLLFTLYLLLTPRSLVGGSDNNMNDDEDDDLNDGPAFFIERGDSFRDDAAAEPIMDDPVEEQVTPGPGSGKGGSSDDDDVSTYRQRRRPSGAVLGAYSQVAPPALDRTRTRRDSSTSFSRRVDRQINAYIKGKLALSLLVGFLTAAVLALLNVDLWLAFGVFSCFANFVPNLGAVVAIALPMPVLFFDPDSSMFTAVLALTSLIILHAVIGNVVEPILFGHSLKLHPVVCLVSMSIWGFLWGCPGLILAVPITAVCRIYLRALDHPLAAGFAGLLDGRSL